MERFRNAVWPVVLVFAMSACGGDTIVTTTVAGQPDGATDDRPLVVVTTSIWGDVVASVGGDQISVEVLMPIGADPHDFVPSSSQVARMQQADLVVANGLGLEEGLLDVVAEVAANGGNVIELAPLLDPIAFTLDHDHDHDDHDHDHDGDDPHVWQDPERVAEAAIIIGDALSGLVADPAGVEARAADYHDRMHDLAHELDETLAPIPHEDRVLVTNHHSLGYFADRFDFTVVGTIVPGGSTLGDPSSSELADLVHLIEDLGIRAIFVETTATTPLAEAVAEELGTDVAVVTLHTDSLGPQGSGAESLEGLFATNADLILAALTAE